MQITEVDEALKTFENWKQEITNMFVDILMLLLKEETTQVVRFCSIIASADGQVSEREEAIIKELIVTLELDLKEFGFWFLVNM